MDWKYAAPVKLNFYLNNYKKRAFALYLFWNW